MKTTELNLNGSKIKLYGNNEGILQKEKTIIENLDLTGNEHDDRLIIQKCIDDNKLKSDISYNGNTIYPFEKTVKLYRQLQKNDSLENLNKYMYHFFTLACGDIAHYDIGGYKSYYNYSIRELENTVLKDIWTTRWQSDCDRIFRELKIGKEYFEEREFINIDMLSVSKLKTIIQDCGWQVSKEGNSWNLQKTSPLGGKFYFEVDISSNKASKIVSNITNYYNSFDKEKFIESMVENRKKIPNSPTISEIVASANNIKMMLSKLSSDVTYKSRLEVEIQRYNQTKNINLIQKDYSDYEYCS